MDLNGDQFRYESRIKDKPNSQGTLFQAPSSMMSDRARYPRGYTPERLASVRKHSKNFNSSGQSSPFETAQLHQNLARSSAPLGHMRTVGWWDTKPMSMGQDSAGVPDKGGYFRDTREIRLQPEHSSNDVAIHELGHSVSAARGLPHSQYSTPQQKGEEEGHAQNYAQEHYRKPGRRGQTLPAQRPHEIAGHAAYWPEEGPEFARSFTRKRVLGNEANRELARHSLSSQQFGGQMSLPGME